MREKMILEGDKSVHIQQMIADNKSRAILAKGHAAAQSMFGANYHTAVELICEEIRELMTESGLDALTAGYLLTSKMERIGGVSAHSKAITMAAIYEVDRQECGIQN